MDKEFLRSLKMGIPTQESEALKLRMGLKTAPSTKKLKPVNEINVENIVSEKEMTRVLNRDVIAGLVSGKGVKNVIAENQGKLYVDTGKMTANEFMKKEYGDNEGDNEPSVGHSNVTKEQIEDCVYDVIGDILEVSKSKMSDKEYVKNLFADAIAFIKIKESLRNG